MCHSNRLFALSLLGILFCLPSFAQNNPKNTVAQSNTVRTSATSQGPTLTSPMNNLKKVSQKLNLEDKQEENSDAQNLSDEKLPTIEDLDLSLDTRIPFEQSLGPGESDALIEPPNFCEGMLWGAEVGSLSTQGLNSRCAVKKALQMSKPNLDAFAKNVWCTSPQQTLLRFQKAEMLHNEEILKTHQLTAKEYAYAVQLKQKPPLNTYWTDYVNKNTLQCTGSPTSIFENTSPIFVIDSLGTTTLQGKNCSKVALMHVRFIQGHLSFAKAPFLLGLDDCAGLTSSLETLAQALISKAAMAQYEDFLLKQYSWKSPPKWRASSASALNLPSIALKTQN